MKRDLKNELARELAQDFTAPALLPPWPIPGDVESRSANRPLVTFSNWNLLGLYRRPEVVAAAHRALEESAIGTGTAQPLGGASFEQERLETRLARFFGSAAAQLFPSKQQAVLSAITAFCREGGAVVGIAGASMPLADAALLTGCEYVEAAGPDLRPALQRVQGRDRIVVCVETTSQLAGESRNISDDLSLCAEFGAWLCVDESASIGIVGARGAGSADTVPWHSALLMRVCSLTLVPGVPAALLACSEEFKSFLQARSWHLQSETGISPVVCSAALVAIDALELMVQARELLRLRVDNLRLNLTANQWDVASAGGIPFLSLRCSSLREAREVQAAMLQRGIVVEALPLRGLRRSDAVLRVLVSLEHTDRHCEALLESLEVCKVRLSRGSSA